MPHKQIMQGEETRARIKAIMRADPRLTGREIAETIGVSHATVRRYAPAIRAELRGETND